MTVREALVVTSLNCSFLENRRVKNIPSGKKRKARVTCTHISRDLWRINEVAVKIKGVRSQILNVNYSMLMKAFKLVSLLFNA